MNPIIKVSLIILGVTILLYIGRTIYHFATRQIDREIADNISVTSEWVEITPQPPLKARNPTQTLILSIEGYKRNYTDNRQLIVFPDGKTRNPEVQILDARGNIYNLKLAQWLSTGVGYSRSFNPESNSTFPQDRAYTKVRIRSDKPFHIQRIVWECYRSMK